jgi:sec-independent protein translocase protein TatA
MDLGIPELLLILVIVIVLFGPGRLARMMGELGNGLRSFRDGLQDDNKEDAPKEDHGKGV